MPRGPGPELQTRITVREMPPKSVGFDEPEGSPFQHTLRLMLSSGLACVTVQAMCRGVGVRTRAFLGSKRLSRRGGR